MTIYSKTYIRAAFARHRVRTLDDEVAVEETADLLGISTNDVLEALREEAEHAN